MLRLAAGEVYAHWSWVGLHGQELHDVPDSMLFFLTFPLVFLGPQTRPCTQARNKLMSLLLWPPEGFNLMEVVCIVLGTQSACAHAGTT